MNKWLVLVFLLFFPHFAWGLETFLKQSTATTVTVTLVSTTDLYSGKTGLSAGLTIRAIKNGSASGATITPTVTEISSANAPGEYALALTSSHTDTLGELKLYITGSGAAPKSVKFEVATYLPGEAAILQADQAVNTTKFGGTSVTGRDIGASVLLSSGAGTGQLDFTSGIVKADARQWLGTTIVSPGTAGTPDINVLNWKNATAPAMTGDAYARLGAPAGASTSADIAAIKSDTGSIKTQTDKFVFTVANQVDCNPYSWRGGTIPAVNVTGVPLVDNKYLLGTIYSTPTVAGIPNVNTKTWNDLATVALPATPTNITAGTITTVTNLTNAPTSGDFTSTMKTSLNAATPAVTVSDKTGFSLSAGGIQAIWDALTSALSTANSIGKLLVDNINATISSRMATFSYTAPDNSSIAAIKAVTDALPNSGALTTLQADTDDIQTRLPAALTANGNIKADSLRVGGTVQTGGDLAALVNVIDDYVDTEVAAIKAKTDNLPADPASNTEVDTRLATSGYTVPPTVGANADAVWDEILSGHTVSGSAGVALTAAGSAGDPWATALPGSYGSGTAGKIVGDNINATISSRLASGSYTAPDNSSVTSIKTKTDQLVFTVSNLLDVNVLDWKSATAPAMTGDSYARLGAPAGASTSADIAAVKSDSAAIKAKTDNLPASPAAVGSNMGTVSSVTGNVGGSVGSVTAGVTVTTNNDKTGYALSSGGIQAIWDSLTSALTTVNSVGKLLVDNINAAISSRLASGSYTAPDNSSITAIKVVTDKVDTTLEADGPVYHFTINALEQGPSGGGGGGGSSVADFLNEPLATYLTGGTVGKALNMLMGDEWIDNTTSPTQWRLKTYLEGTTTVLTIKDMKKLDGNPVTAATQTIGKKVKTP